MNIQPTLQNSLVTLTPLKETDFDNLFKVAANSKIWEQHPNPNRFKIEEFTNYFKGAIESKGAFLITENEFNKIIGSSRFYDFNQEENSLFIGYSFIDTPYWGGVYNKSIKKIMLDYIFDYVALVKFHVGKYNIRSQKAMQKLGAISAKEIAVSYYGEAPQINFEFCIKKEDWLK